LSINHTNSHLILLELIFDTKHKMNSEELCGYDYTSALYTGAFFIRWAVENGTIDDLQKAIDHVKGTDTCASACVNYNMTDGGKETDVLYTAVVLNDAEKVRLLIDSGAHVDDHAWHELYESYDTAAQARHCHVFEMLEQAQDDWNYHAKHGGEERFD
jgi:hypothetical protein